MLSCTPLPEPMVTHMASLAYTKLSTQSLNLTFELHRNGEWLHVPYSRVYKWFYRQARFVFALWCDCSINEIPAHRFYGYRSCIYKQSCRNKPPYKTQCVASVFTAQNDTEKAFEVVIAVAQSTYRFFDNHRKHNNPCLKMPVVDFIMAGGVLLSAKEVYPRNRDDLTWMIEW